MKLLIKLIAALVGLTLVAFLAASGRPSVDLLTILLVGALILVIVGAGAWSIFIYRRFLKLGQAYNQLLSRQPAGQPKHGNPIQSSRGQVNSSTDMDRLITAAALTLLNKQLPADSQVTGVEKHEGGEW